MNRSKREIEFIERMCRIIQERSVDEALRLLATLKSDVDSWLAGGKIQKWQYRTSMIQINKKAIDKLFDSNRTESIRDYWNRLNELCSNLGVRGVNPTEFVDGATFFALHLHQQGSTAEAIEILANADERLKLVQTPGVRQWKKQSHIVGNAFRAQLANRDAATSRVALRASSSSPAVCTRGSRPDRRAVTRRQCRGHPVSRRN